MTGQALALAFEDCSSSFRIAGNGFGFRVPWSGGRKTADVTHELPGLFRREAGERRHFRTKNAGPNVGEDHAVGVAAAKGTCKGGTTIAAAGRPVAVLAGAIEERLAGGDGRGIAGEGISLGFRRILLRKHGRSDEENGGGES